MIRAILPIRGQDRHGSGAWGAPRGNRRHQGVDYECYPGTVIQSHLPGTVTKLGYPYGDDLSFRYVQVTDDDGRHHRFFYIEPSVKVGDELLPGDAIGKVQNLDTRYPGIHCHVHYEIKRNGHYLNPELEGRI